MFEQVELRVIGILRMSIQVERACGRRCLVNYVE
jgi:hypothetical protein